MSIEAPEECLDIVIAILERDASDRGLANLAAGPVEEALVNHGERIIDRVESTALSNAPFRKLLGGVWLDDVAPHIAKRVERARETQW